jgi:hypothetical protein
MFNSLGGSVEWSNYRGSACIRSRLRTFRHKLEAVRSRNIHRIIRKINSRNLNKSNRRTQWRERRANKTRQNGVIAPGRFVSEEKLLERPTIHTVRTCM